MLKSGSFVNSRGKHDQRLQDKQSRQPDLETNRKSHSVVVKRDPQRGCADAATVLRASDAPKAQRSFSSRI